MIFIAIIVALEIWLRVTLSVVDKIVSPEKIAQHE